MYFTQLGSCATRIVPGTGMRPVRQLLNLSRRLSCADYIYFPGVRTQRSHENSSFRELTVLKASVQCRQGLKQIVHSGTSAYHVL